MTGPDADVDARNMSKTFLFRPALRNTRAGSLDQEQRSRIKQRSVLLATCGFLLLLAVVLLLDLAGVVEVELRAWALALGGTLLCQSVLWIIPRMGWDRHLTVDRHYLIVPMLAAAGLLGTYMLVVPEFRHVLLMTWFVALLFMTGLAGFLEVVALATIMAGVYVGVVGLLAYIGRPVSVAFELVGAGLFLTINAYAGLVFQRLRSERREMRRLREKLAEQAVTDPLTGLPNRRYFDEFLQAELERIERYGGSCAVAFVDVDEFKNYNDRLGHLAGDEVLRELAEVFREEVRVSDLVARYGGEEFAVIMVNSTREEARQAASRLREVVERHPFTDQDIQPSGNLTVSVGVAAYPEDGETYEELIQMADDALYRAKRQGKNRVAVAE